MRRPAGHVGELNLGSPALSVHEVAEPVHNVECKLTIVIAGNIHSHLEGTAIERATANRKDLGREHGRFPKNCYTALAKWHGESLCVPTRYPLPNRDVL